MSPNVSIAGLETWCRQLFQFAIVAAHGTVNAAAHSEYYEDVADAQPQLVSANVSFPEPERELFSSSSLTCPY